MTQLVCYTIAEFYVIMSLKKKSYDICDVRNLPGPRLVIFIVLACIASAETELYLAHSDALEESSSTEHRRYRTFFSLET